MNTFSFKQTQGGFTLLEMVIVIAMIGYLGTIVLDRLWKYRVYAEEAAVTATVGNIRSALGLEVAKLAVRGNAEKIALLQNTNPILLLAQKPHNYLGEFKGYQTIETTGVWYFDTMDSSLNYIVAYPENFISNIIGTKRTRHQLSVIFADNNKNKRYDKGIDNINGLDLVAKEPYRWLIEK